MCQKIIKSPKTTLPPQKKKNLCIKLITIAFWLVNGSIWAAIAFVHVQNKVREHYMRLGYERGMAHAKNYYYAFGTLPEKPWIEKHWRYINTKNGWVTKR